MHHPNHERRKRAPEQQRNVSLPASRNPRVPADLAQENPCPVAATSPLYDANAARAREIRTQARMALVQSQDDTSLRTVLAARPRAERNFLAEIMWPTEISEV